jgi:hypothetical protein
MTKINFHTLAAGSVALTLALALALAGCGSSTPSSNTPSTNPPVAADNGQPRMKAAWDALASAKTELEAASPNKGGHREKAIELVNAAMKSVKEGMDYAAANPTEVGAEEGAAPPEPVSGEVPGAEKQPHMAQAMIFLREARKQLVEAKHDKGGHRSKAIEHVHGAMVQVRDGIHFSNEHP